MRRTSILLLIIVLYPGASNAQPEDSVRLSTEEIRQTFANVRDSAQVQDSVGTTATNIWLEDGTFSNHWSSDRASGTVTGKWYAENDQRCVIILSGLPEAIGRKRCGPIYKRGNTYISVNADGSVHGIHRLSPL